MKAYTFLFYLGLPFIGLAGYAADAGLTGLSAGLAMIALAIEIAAVTKYNEPEPKPKV